MKQLLLIAFVASFIFAGCTKRGDEPQAESKDGRIGFTTEVSSKGASTTTATIDHFQVFGYATQTLSWAEAADTAVPALFENSHVQRIPDGSGYVWDYSGPEVKWPEGFLHFFTFFGYSPQATADNGIVAPAHGVANVPRLSFTVKDDVAEQLDLLYAATYNVQASNDPVMMNFKHALSRISFKAFATSKDVIVNKIEITGVKFKGNFLLDGQWSSDAEAHDFSLTMKAPITLPVEAISAETAIGLVSGDDSFLLLPQDIKTNGIKTAKIIFSFSIEGTPITKEYIISEDWQKGKSITYTVDLTTSLQEELNVSKVTITPWGLGADESGSAEGEAQIAKITYQDNSSKSEVEALQSSVVTVDRRPSSVIEAWNTKADGTGEFYGIGDEILLEGDMTLYNADNTVTIGGMRWLRGNLSGTVGTSSGWYAGSSTSFGAMFKWGDQWVYQRESSTTDGVIGTNVGNASTTPSGTSTQFGYDYGAGLSGGRSSGDPCKKLGDNFMTPTTAQYQTLINLGTLYGTYRGVEGYFLGVNAGACTDTKIAEECIFMPATGYRSFVDGTLGEANVGYYWTSTVSGSINGQRLRFTSGSMSATAAGNRGFAIAVRCVATDVTLAGAKWTTTNLEGTTGSALGHKLAARPSGYGDCFKWGDRWVYAGSASSTDGMMGGVHFNASTTPNTTLTGATGYDYVGLAGGRASGDPCKMLGANYQTPTYDQYIALKSLPNVLGSYKGAQGYFFGTSTANNNKIASGAIFIPLSGYRYYDSGNFGGFAYCFYWVSTVSNRIDNGHGYVYLFSVDYSRPALTTSDGRAFGLPVRCVRID